MSFQQVEMWPENENEREKNVCFKLRHGESCCLCLCLTAEAEVLRGFRPLCSIRRGPLDFTAVREICHRPAVSDLC